MTKAGDVETENGELSRGQSVRTGTAGWVIPKDARACFISEGSHLQRYAHTLNCAEINSSFYRPHRHETWRRWANSVPDEFRFSVKAPRRITHEARLECGSEVLLPFLQQVSFLGDKLGPILIQLPPSLEFDESIASRFLLLLRENHSGEVVWEPRHSSWFEDRADALLQEFRIARVAADPACVPAAARPGGFGTVAYFRLHGSPRLYYSDYREDFLNGLAAQLVNLAMQARVWCIFDNTAAGHAIQNALQLARKMKDGPWPDFLASSGD